MKFVSIEWLGRFDEAIITVEEELLGCNPLGWLLGWSVPGERRRYRGDCTVWHDAETGERANTFQEGKLCDIWTRERWDRERWRRNDTV